MADYRTMFDSDWIKAWDLGGKPIIVQMIRVEARLLQNQKSTKKERKPAVWFRGGAKPLALNKTNAKTIAALYGNDTKAWIGRNVTLYPTRTQFGNEEVDCIRVKPLAPKGKAQNMPNPSPPPEVSAAGEEPEVEPDIETEAPDDTDTDAGDGEVG